MAEVLLPKADRSKFAGSAGVNRVSQIFNDDFRWIFRKVNQEDDFGIDGFADVVTDEGHVTGQSVAVQIKHGTSYFRQETATHVIFNGELKHLNYYQNIAVPVLIILSDPEGDIFWARFDLKDTERTKGGWKIEVPKVNKLNTQAKPRILAMLPPFRNVMQEAEEQWAFNAGIRESSVILYHIDPDDIRDGNVDNFFDFITRLSDSKKVLRDAQGKLELYTSAYDHDRREVWEIKPMVRWVKAADKKGIPWFYFCNTDLPVGWLRIYAVCMSGGKRERVIAGANGVRAHIEVSMAPRKVAKLLEINWPRLNLVCEAVGVSEDELRRISFAAAAAIGLPIGEGPSPAFDNG